ncbi:MAG: hypothetical protein JWQ45_1575 [Blastococcus sp.]|nr:hypothetical protein [Blastococcus sp.]
MIVRSGSAVNDRSTAGQRDALVRAQLHSLAPQLDGEPDPAFRAATRARLVAMAAVRSPHPEPVSPLRRLLAARSTDAVPAPWRTRLTAGLAGAALTVTALSTLVALSTDARPGDVLYGLKRGTEQTQLALAGDSRRGETLLGLASTRLGELDYLVSEGPSALPAAGAAPAGGEPVVLAADSEAELVLQTLDTMDAQTTDGASWLTERSVDGRETAPLEELAGWAAGQSAGLAALQPEVPEVARPAFDDSLELLAQIDARTAALRTAMDCPAGPATDGADALGPVPGTCPADAAGDRGTVTVRGGTTGATPPAEVATGVPGGTSGDAGSSGSGGTGPADGVPGGGGAGGVPAPAVPGGGGLPTPSLPTPSLPLPSIGVQVPTTPAVPSLPLPGIGSLPTPSAELHVDVCLGPITIGSC